MAKEEEPVTASLPSIEAVVEVLPAIIKLLTDESVGEAIGKVVVEVVGENTIGACEVTVLLP